MSTMKVVVTLKDGREFRGDFQIHLVNFDGSSSSAELKDVADIALIESFGGPVAEVE